MFSNILLSRVIIWGGRVRVVVFNSTFDNISIISWLLVLLMEETGVSIENQQLAASHWQLYHIILYQVYLDMSEIGTHNAWLFELLWFF